MKKIIYLLLFLSILSSCVSHKKTGPSLGGGWAEFRDPETTETQMTPVKPDAVEREITQSKEEATIPGVKKPVASPLLKKMARQVVKSHPVQVKRIEQVKQKISRNNRGSGQLLMWFLLFVLCLAAVFGLMYLLGVALDFKKMGIGLLVIVLLLLLLMAIEEGFWD